MVTEPRFDEGSPYAASTPDVVKGYLRITVKGHPLGDARGRVMAHRAVLWDAIGEGPHRCHWCGFEGLRWDVDRRDPLYLVVDHLDGDGFDNRLEALVPSCAFDNDNRSVMAELGIPWSVFDGVAPGDRKPLRQKVSGAPTPYALSLVARPAAEVEPVVEAEPVVVPPPPVPVTPVAPPRSAPRDGWVRWADLVGADHLLAPPAELLAAHPKLRTINFEGFRW